MDHRQAALGISLERSRPVKAVLQRVQASQVVVDRSIVGQIGPGVLVLLGVGPSDTPAISHRM
ncbi:MAG: D-aminoacyl-tRNA deacylase, partial [Pirellulaceae bacterium]